MMNRVLLVMLRLEGILATVWSPSLFTLSTLEALCFAYVNRQLTPSIHSM